MKNGVILASFLALLGLTAANAQMQNFYVRGGFGPLVTDDVNLREFANENVNGAKLEFDPGFNFDAVFGYKVTPWFALEGETGISYNEADGKGFSSNGDLAVSRYPMMINAVFQIPNPSRIVPFVGIGGGGAISVLFADDFSVGGTTADGTFDDFVLAYHAFGGVRYDFNPQMGISIYYKYLTTDPSDWEADSNIGTSGNIKAASLHSHSISVAFTFQF